MWAHDSPMGRNWRDRFGFIPSILLSRSGITIPLLTISTTNPVACVAISHDGNQIISGSWGGVQVWDANTSEQLMDLHGHTIYVSSVAFSPDGNRIVSGSWDKSVRVWDSKTGKQLREVLGHTDNVNSVGFSPDGNRIVSGSKDNSVRVWDAKTGEQLWELRGHTKNVSSVAFSPNGNRIGPPDFTVAQPCMPCLP
jgi:WD40 repeat protein